MKPLADQTLYEVLEIPVDAAESEILRACERMQALFAPDSLATYTLTEPAELALLGKRIEEARTILLDPVARASYDARLTKTPIPRRGRGGNASGRPLPRIIPPLGKRWAEPVAPESPALDLEKRDALIAALNEQPRVKLLPEAIESPPEPAPLVILATVTATPATPPESPTEDAQRSDPFALSGAPPEAARSRRAAIDTETSPQPIPLQRLAPAPIPLDMPAPIPLATPAVVPAPVAAPTPAPVSPPFAAVASVEPLAPPMAPVTAVADAAPPRALRPIEKDIFVHEGTRYTGDVLRRAREARGLTLQALSDRTKITRHHIENLEADRYDKLPAAVYLRGILMAVAKELRLDGQKVARSYLEAVATAAHK